MILVNGSRNLSMKVEAFLPARDRASSAFFRQAIPLYAATLQRHLLKETTRVELDEQPHPELPDLAHVQHQPNQIAMSIYRKVTALRASGSLSAEQLIVLNEELPDKTDV